MVLHLAILYGEAKSTSPSKKEINLFKARNKYFTILMKKKKQDLLLHFTIQGCTMVAKFGYIKA
jgi:hypothetical protein